MILDVGAGHRANGDVNVDLYPEATIHRTTTDGVMHQCKKQLIPNFVRADAQHLPFRTGVFDEVYSSNVLEHVLVPEFMLDEMLRVSRDKVTVTVPHRYGRHAKQKGHIHFFSNKWFQRYAERKREVYNWSTMQDTRGFPLEVLSVLRLPNQITFTMRVSHNGNHAR